MCVHIQEGSVEIIRASVATSPRRRHRVNFNLPLDLPEFPLCIPCVKNIGRCFEAGVTVDGYMGAFVMGFGCFIRRFLIKLERDLWFDLGAL